MKYHNLLDFQKKQKQDKDRHDFVDTHSRLGPKDTFLTSKMILCPHPQTAIDSSKKTSREREGSTGASRGIESGGR